MPLEILYSDMNKDTFMIWVVEWAAKNPRKENVVTYYPFIISPPELVVDGIEIPVETKKGKVTIITGVILINFITGHESNQIIITWPVVFWHIANLFISDTKAKFKNKGRQSKGELSATQRDKSRKGGPLPPEDEEKIALVTGWLDVSGKETQESYCNRKGISVSTLTKYRRELVAKGLLKK